MYLLNEETVLELIDEFRGNVSAIARACGVYRSSVIAFIERRPKLIQAVRDARAAMVDDARRQLALQAAEGKQWAVTHVLRTAGPAEFDSRLDNPEPELTDEERLRLLQELVERVKRREEARAGSNDAAAVTSESTEQPSPSPAGISAELAPLQQFKTADESQQYRYEPNAAPFVHEAREHQMENKRNCSVAQVCIFGPSVAGVIADNPPRLQQPTYDYTIHQHSARNGAPRADEARRDEVGVKINSGVAQVDRGCDFGPPVGVIPDIRPRLQQAATTYYNNVHQHSARNGAPRAGAPARSNDCGKEQFPSGKNETRSASEWRSG